MAKKKSIHYVDNKKFYAAMVDYISRLRYAKETGGELPRIPEYIGECFYKIAMGLSCSPNFINYSFRDDMIGDGYETCVMYIHNFDPDKYNNPFAYFTQYCYNAFILRIKKEKKQSYVKYKSLERALVNNDLSHFQDDDTGNYVQSHNNDYMNNVISSFEDDIKKRKEKTKKSKE